MPGSASMAERHDDRWQPGGPWDAQATSELLWNVQMAKSEPRHEHTTKTAAANAQVEELQRIVAKPAAYRFELEKLSPSPDK